jgi:hypothetical protein
MTGITIVHAVVPAMAVAWTTSYFATADQLFKLAHERAIFSRPEHLEPHHSAAFGY